MKKILILICLAYLFCLQSISAYAQGGTTGSLTWQITGTGNNLTLTISGNGNMPSYLDYGPWLSYNINIRTIIISNGVTSIGDRAFRGCSNLATLTIPNSVTLIGYLAFWNCSSLPSVSIPNAVTIIREDAFSDCSNLTTVNFNAINCTTMGTSTYPVFRDCTSLTTLHIGNNVSRIPANAFKGCSNLTGTLIIPNSVTTIESSAFSGCISLTSLNISNSVTTIENSTFYGCSGLSSLTIPNSVTTVGSSAFYGCFGLSSLTIPNSVTTIGSLAFSNCTGLPSITIPNSVTSIGNNAFSNCSYLTTVNFNATDCATMGAATNPVFANCTSLRNLYIGNNVRTIPAHAFRGCGNLIGTLTIPNSVTSIGNSAFYDCNSITGLTIGTSVTSIGDYAFNGCSSFTTLTIPNLVITIGNYAFNNCNRITNLNIGSSVTTIGNYAFNNCSNITSLTIGSSVSSIGEYAFNGCSSFTTLTIPNSVTSIGNHAFRGCSNLATVNFNATNCTTMGSVNNPVFLSCSSLTTLNIGSNVLRIPNYAFSDCNALPTVTIPSAVTTIGDYAFRYCFSLNTVNFNATNCTTMGTSTNPVFSGCTSLTALNIGNNVTRVPNFAFYNCSGLNIITSYPMTPPTISNNTFYNVSTSIPVRVPCLLPYQSAQYWNIFTNYQSMGATAPSQPGTISGVNIVCAGGGTQTYSISAVSDATSYTWSLPSGWSGSSTSTSISATPGSNAQSGNISVTANNPCGSSTARTLNVTVNSVPAQPGTISGVTAVCAGSGAQGYSITAMSGVTSYTWNLPSGWSGNPTGNTISATPGSNAQSGNISVTANNGCGSSPVRTLNVTVNSIPAQPNTINGNTTVCAEGAAQIYSITTVSGATSYTWSLPSGWSGSSTSTSISATPGSNAQSGNISVIANNDCGTSPARTLSVTVNSPPSQPGIISGATTVCADGNTQSYSISSVSDATNYTWIVPSGWTGASTGTNIFATPGSNAQSGNIQVKANNSCGSSSESILTVTVSTPPSAPTSINGENIINFGQSTTLTASGGSGESDCTYQWGMGACGSNIISGQTGSSITVNPASTTTYWARRVGVSPCNNTTPCATVTVTVTVGINENLVSGINIYPNPTTGKLRITSSELRISDIQIFDIYGRNLLSPTSPMSPETTIDISHLPAGVYFVKINTEAGEVVRKILKE